MRNVFIALAIMPGRSDSVCRNDQQVQVSEYPEYFPLFVTDFFVSHSETRLQYNSTTRWGESASFYGAFPQGK